MEKGKLHLAQMAERQTVKASSLTQDVKSLKSLTINLIFLFLYAVTVLINELKAQLNVDAEVKITARTGNFIIRSKGKCDCI